MRSPAPTPGRNRRLENLWRLITGFTRRIFGGSQRPLATRGRGGALSLVDRRYDLEISEYPVRDSERARELIEICEYCPEAAAAIEWIVGDCLSSQDGDDQGFRVADTLVDESPVNPDVYRIASDCLTRAFPATAAEMALERLTSWGDAFAELAIDERRNEVQGVMFLPTWELFRIEPQGELLGFQQRRSLSDSNPIPFVPLKVVHWRYRRKTLYGRGLFYESGEDWANLRQATRDLAAAAIAVGINPNVHELGEGADKEYLEAYRAGQRDQRMDGVITDYYLLPGEKISKLATVNPDLTALAETVLTWRSRIVMKSGVPPYLLGLPTVGAREIAGQPALAYARRINRIRGCLTEGIIQILHTELGLKGIDPSLWLNKLRITYPKIVVNTFDEAPGADENPGSGADTESLKLPILSLSNGKKNY